VAAMMGAELGWSDAKKAQEIAQMTALLAADTESLVSVAA